MIVQNGLDDSIARQGETQLPSDRGGSSPGANENGWDETAQRAVDSSNAQTGKGAHGNIKLILIATAIVVVLISYTALYHVSRQTVLPTTITVTSTVPTTAEPQIVYNLTSYLDSTTGQTGSSGYEYNLSLSNATGVQVASGMVFNGYSYLYKPFAVAMPQFLSNKTTLATDFPIPANFSNYSAPLFVEFMISNITTKNITASLCSSSSDVSCFTNRTIPETYDGQTALVHERMVYSGYSNGLHMYSFIDYTDNGTQINNMVYVYNRTQLGIVAIYAIKKSYNYSYGIELGRHLGSLLYR